MACRPGVFVCIWWGNFLCFKPLLFTGVHTSWEERGVRMSSSPYSMPGSSIPLCLWPRGHLCFVIPASLFLKILFPMWLISKLPTLAVVPQIYLKPNRGQASNLASPQCPTSYSMQNSMTKNRAKTPSSFLGRAVAWFPVPEYLSLGFGIG